MTMTQQWTGGEEDKGKNTKAERKTTTSEEGLYN